VICQSPFLTEAKQKSNTYVYIIRKQRGWWQGLISTVAFSGRKRGAVGTHPYHGSTIIFLETQYKHKYLYTYEHSSL
jgi:hypothetical protein